MEKTKEVIKAKGVVSEKLPNAMFRVELTEIGDDEKRAVLTKISGRMRRGRIRVLVGDRVEVEMSPYDLERGRIVYRYK